MVNLVVKAIMLLALPTVVFTGGAFIMAKLSGRESVTQRLSEQKTTKKDATPLGFRITGYDLAAVKNHWSALDHQTLGFEKRGLELDLMFPFFYGAALAAALLLAWAALDRPFSPVWLLTPVAITMLADWTENLVQLSQLRLFNLSDKTGLQAGWIQIASAATMVKLVFYGGASLLLIYLVVKMIVRGVTMR